MEQAEPTIQNVIAKQSKMELFGEENERDEIYSNHWRSFPIESLNCSSQQRDDEGLFYRSERKKKQEILFLIHKHSLYV